MHVRVERKCLEIESDTHQILGKDNYNLKYNSPEWEAGISEVYVRGINRGRNLIWFISNNLVWPNENGVLEPQDLV